MVALARAAFVVAFLTYAVAAPAQTMPVASLAGDYDGDSKADLAIFRPSTGEWYIRNSSTDFTTHSVYQWGLSGDVPVPADYDGDQRMDLAVYRPLDGVWHVLQSSTGYVNSVTFKIEEPASGAAVPVPADYDGDGKADPAVFKVPGPDTNPVTFPGPAVIGSHWVVLMSSTNYTQRSVSGRVPSSDLPVPADYDNDGKTDKATYRPSTGTWHITRTTDDVTVTTQWGLNGDIPLPGDYDGDAQIDLAVFRPSSGTWYILQSSTSTSVSFQWGLYDDVPVPGDYNGDDTVDLVVYRPSTGMWFVGSDVFQWGLTLDVPASHGLISTAIAMAGNTIAISRRRADFDGDARADLAVFRPSESRWYTLRTRSGALAFSRGFVAGDRPAPNDYDGDGTTDLGVYRPSTGEWYIRQASCEFGTLSCVQFLSSTSRTFQWGLDGDVPVSGDYDGDAIADLAVYRPATGEWFITFSGGFSYRSAESYDTTATYQWGLSGDVPLPGDYDGDGVTDLAAFRPSTGMWFIRQSSTGDTTSATYQWGLSEDIPVPGDYDGDGATDLTVYRPSNGTWFIRQSSTNFSSYLTYQWGLSGDIPIGADVDGDGRFDLAVWRPSSGTWYLLNSSSKFTAFTSVHWGLPGDIPTGTQP